jgi:hypothetical protein
MQLVLELTLLQELALLPSNHFEAPQIYSGYEHSNPKPILHTF